MILPARLDPDVGERLTDKEFFADFNHRFWRNTAFYKLERAQHFAEPHDPSWQAFAHGRWEEALDLIEARRPLLEAQHRKATDSGTVPRRIRIVEEPLTPYLQWELHLLQLRDQVTGGTIRVLPAMFVAADEHAYGSRLPEVSIMDDAAMYLHKFDAHGVQDHNLRYTDAETVQTWLDYTERLWNSGWPLADYFDSYVRCLPAPEPDTRPPDTLLDLSVRYQPDERLLTPSRRAPNHCQPRTTRPHLIPSASNSSPVSANFCTPR
jgi:hypothetical protein